VAPGAPPLALHSWSFGNATERRAPALRESSPQKGGQLAEQELCAPMNDARAQSRLASARSIVRSKLCEPALPERCKNRSFCSRKLSGSREPTACSNLLGFKSLEKRTLFYFESL
jgi:hypothetical protein